MPRNEIGIQLSQDGRPHEGFPRIPHISATRAVNPALKTPPEIVSQTRISKTIKEGYSSQIEGLSECRWEIADGTGEARFTTNQTHRQVDDLIKTLFREQSGK